MSLVFSKQTVTTEASQEINGYTYLVAYTTDNEVLQNIAIRIVKEETEQGLVECGNLNRDSNNTYINMLSNEDVFLHTGIMADICKKIENIGKPKKKKED